MKIYTCKKRGQILSVDCSRCFYERNEDPRQASRPQCVAENVTEEKEISEHETKIN